VNRAAIGYNAASIPVPDRSYTLIRKTRGRTIRLTRKNENAGSTA
jgi:hypothetical protein